RGSRSAPCSRSRRGCDRQPRPFPRAPSDREDDRARGSGTCWRAQDRRCLADTTAARRLVRYREPPQASPPRPRHTAAQPISPAYKADFIVEERVVVEIKCVDRVLAVHETQLVSYLKLTGLPLGLLLNFKVAHMRNGITRRINAPENEL